MASSDADSMLTVEVCYAHASGVWRKSVRLSAGAQLGEALEASGFMQAFPDVDPRQAAVGIYGLKRDLDHVLHPGDRVEIYRPLVFDPKESRRRRAQHRAARAGRGKAGADPN